MGQPEDLDSPPPGDRPRDQDHHRMPTWVKGFLAATLIAVLLVVVVLVVSGGEHGPSRHLPDSGDTEIHTPPPGHTPPLDHG